MPDYRILAAGDTALVVEFGESIDREVNGRVLELARHLRALAPAGVSEIVPTFRSLCVTFEPLQQSFAQLAETIAALLHNAGPALGSGRRWHFPVCYDESLAPDLHEVAARTGMPGAQIAVLHSAPTYHAYMLGFLPGQAYLGDLPPALALPRRATPRERIAAGSVCIAMTMTCIFPAETPCGWHVIGRSPVPLWRLDRDAVPLLQPGDCVRFRPVSLRDYHVWLERTQSEAFDPAQLAEPEGIAA